MFSHVPIRWSKTINADVVSDRGGPIIRYSRLSRISSPGVGVEMEGTVEGLCYVSLTPDVEVSER